MVSTSLAPPAVVAVCIISALAYFIRCHNLASQLILAVVLYLFSILYPLLFFIRLGLYWKAGAQLFMLDPCYFINWCTLFYILYLPHNPTVKKILFSLSTGYAMWAVIPFRNTLAFHDIDKVTSVFIHIMPSKLFFCLHWLPSNTSRGWIAPIPYENQHLGKALLRHHSMELENVAILVLGPIILTLIHGLLYWLFVYIIFRPNERYLDSYRYLTKKNVWVDRFVSEGNTVFGYLSFLLLNTLFVAVTALASILAYHFILFHCVAFVIQWLLIIRNAASYYIDYFPIKQNATDEEKDD